MKKAGVPQWNACFFHYMPVLFRKKFDQIVSKAVGVTPKGISTLQNPIKKLTLTLFEYAAGVRFFTSYKSGSIIIPLP